MSATTPSVGRILHYTPHPKEFLNWERKDQPLPVQIIYVHPGPEQLVDIVGHDQRGLTFFRERIPIRGSVSDGRYVGSCDWMPYQKAVAAGELEPTRHADPFSGVGR